MTNNGHEQTMALAIGQPMDIFTHDPDVTRAETIQVGIQMVEALGIAGLFQDKAYRHLASKLPEPEKDEQPWIYAARAREHLLECVPAKERKQVAATILDLGMDRADTSADLYRTVRRVLAFRVYAGIGDDSLAGLYVDSPSAPESFEEWLAGVSRQASGAEKSRIRTSCETLLWLISNEADWPEALPTNVEEVFYPGNWRKWVDAFTEVRKRRDVLDLVEEKEKEHVKQSIEAILKEAKREGSTLDTVKETARKDENKTRLPEIVAREQAGKNAAGQVTVHIQLSAAQKTFFQQRAKQWLVYRLEGETYNTEDATLVEYRCEKSSLCPKCGTLYRLGLGLTTCPPCEGNPLFYLSQWHSRSWTQDNGWTDWVEEEGLPDEPGIYEDEREDEGLGLRYIRYWEV